MKNKFKQLFLLLSLISTEVFAQSIGINNPTPDASAALDVVSTTKGVLVPRLTAAQRTLIASPATGLLVYQTDEPSGFYFYANATWTLLGATGPQGVKGDKGDKGDTGVNGLAGATGPIGPQGPIGLTGSQGPAGSQGIAGPAGIGYGGTSSSAKTISLGSKTFVVQAGLAYIAGERIRFVDQTNAVNFLEGTITSYSGASMVVNIDNTGGSGTVSNWNLSVGGNLGTNGIGVPTGGTAGQVLSKIDGTNFNTQWVTPSTAAAAYPNVELNINNNISQSITSLGNGTTANLIAFSGSNSANASLTGGNTWNGNTFTVGSTGAGWYQINAQIIGTTTDGVTSSNIGIPFYMDLNNAVGGTMSSAILYRSNYSSNTNVTHLKNNNTLSNVLYLSAGNTLSFYGFSASNTVAGNTSNNSSTYLNITRIK